SVARRVSRSISTRLSKLGSPYRAPQASPNHRSIARFDVTARSASLKQALAACQSVNQSANWAAIASYARQAHIAAAASRGALALLGGATLYVARDREDDQRRLDW